MKTLKLHMKSIVLNGYEVVDLLSPEMKERFEIEFGVKVKERQGEGRKWAFDNVILKDFNNVKDVHDEGQWVEHVGKIILHKKNKYVKRPKRPK